MAQDILHRNFASGLLSMLGFKRREDSTSATRIMYEGYIANYLYHQGQKLEHLFTTGTIFRLRHEPDNPFDENTVAVFYEDAKIGFVPQHKSHHIAQLLKKGKKLKAKVAKISPEEEPWARIHVQVVEDNEPLTG